MFDWVKYITEIEEKLYIFDTKECFYTVKFRRYCKYEILFEIISTYQVVNRVSFTHKNKIILLLYKDILFNKRAQCYTETVPLLVIFHKNILSELGHHATKTA